MYNIDPTTKQLNERVSGIEGLEFGIVPSTANVSSPPTDAELDAEFGNASDLYDGFVALIDDNGAATTYWLVIASNSKWVYTSMTIAV